MHNGIIERGVCLTEEEALGVLDILMVSKADMNLEQRSAFFKISEYYRTFIREAEQLYSKVPLENTFIREVEQTCSKVPIENDPPQIAAIHR